jgi:hypothetical protein
MLLLEDRDNEDINHAPASFVEVEASTDGRSRAGPGLHPGDSGIKELFVARVLGIVQAPCGFDPGGGDADQEMHADRRALPL